MQSYLTDSYQRVKANNFYSLWSLIRNAVNFRLIQQILQVMLMIIPPTLLLKKCEVENKLRIASVKLFKWFHENDIKSNQDKCHFFSVHDITTELQVSDCSVKNSSSEKLLGIIIDRKVNFNENFTDLRNNASKKFEELPRIFFVYASDSKKTFNECLFPFSIWMLPFSLNEPQQNT